MASDPPPGRSEERGATERDVPGVIAPPPLVYLAGLLAGFALEAVLPSVSVPDVVAWPVGLGLLIAGFAFLWSFLAAFRSARPALGP